MATVGDEMSSPSGIIANDSRKVYPRHRLPGVCMKWYVRLILLFKRPIVGLDDSNLDSEGWITVSKMYGSTMYVLFSGSVESYCEYKKEKRRNRLIWVLLLFILASIISVAE